MLFSKFDILRIFEALQIFFYKFLLKWRKIEEDFESSIFLKLKNIILRLNRSLIFFSMVIFATWKSLWKSTLKMTTLLRRCSIQRWNIQRCFNVDERCKVQRWRTQRCFNVDLTLCDVATSCQSKSNFEPKLKCLLGSLLTKF